MNETRKDVEQSFSPDSEAGEQWETIEKIAGSEGFRRSPRLREFLFYVASQQLSGHPEAITEQIVGHRVYRRSETYNPTDDNIVRVSARQLRTKLREYYEAEGLRDTWIVDIPKGGYTPQFRLRTDPVLATQPPSLPISPGDAAPAPQPPAAAGSARSLRAWSVWASLATLAVLLPVGYWLGVQAGLHRNAAAPRRAPASLITALFAGPAEPVQVVVSDSSLSVLQSVSGRPYTLDEYAAHDYMQPPPGIAHDSEAARMWQALVTRQLVNLGDVGATNRFSRALAAVGDAGGVTMVSAQNMHARDFRSGNFILLGSSTSDPWVHMFDSDRLNFAFVELPSTHRLAITNRRPRPGELPIYPVVSGSHQGYARIAFVSNLTETGRVLLIEGTSMESTEAATSFSLDARSLGILMTALHARHTSELPSFEALLRTWEESGTGVNAELLAVRNLGPAQ